MVEAYTGGRAIAAYRLTRFVLRHRALMGLAVASLIVASVAAVFALRADIARQRAESCQSQAEELIPFMVIDLQEKLESDLEACDMALPF